MKNILRTLFFCWWFLAISGIFSISYFNLQYDAGGNEGLIWWGTFLISAPFGIIGEGVGELFPNSMNFLSTAFTFLLGSISIYLMYRVAVWTAARGNASPPSK